jgi:hypothetical protein
MPTSDLAWGTIHPSAYRHAAALLRRAEATARPRGALRYQCPVTGSFVLVTDEASLQRLTGKRTRLRCSACDEMHLLSPDVAGAAIVATPSDA